MKKKTKMKAIRMIRIHSHQVNLHIGGGVKFDYFMVDVHRHGPTVPNETYDERVGL